jgi:hypothetical protein
LEIIGGNPKSLQVSYLAATLPLLRISRVLHWALSEGVLLNGWPMIVKIWLGIVCAGFLVVSYRVDKGKKWGYWSQRLRLAPIAFLAFLLFMVGMLVLHAFHMAGL